MSKVSSNYGSFKFDLSSISFTFPSNTLKIPENAKIFLETSVQFRPKVFLEVTPLIEEDPKKKKGSAPEPTSGLIEDIDEEPYENSLNKFEKLSFMPNKDIVLKTPHLVPTILTNENVQSNETELKTCQLLLPGNSFLSSLIQLDSDNLNRIVQSSIIFTVFLQNPEVAPSTSTKKKDATPIPAAPILTQLFKFGLSVGAFVSSRCEPISFQNISLENLFSYTNQSSHTKPLFFPIEKTSSLEYSDIHLNLSLAPDIPLSEFVSYGVTLWISNGSISNLHKNLLLTFPPEDMTGSGGDKKAKQALSPEESRQKYIKTLQSYLDAQLSLVRYHLNFESSESEDQDKNLGLKTSLRNGLLSLNMENVNSSSLTESLFNSDLDIFNLNFSQNSNYFFLSKMDIYKLLVNHHHFSTPFNLKFTLKKEILNPDLGNSESYEGSINLNPLLNNNENNVIEIPLQFNDNNEERNIGFINIEFSHNLFNSIIYSTLFPQDINQSGLDTFSNSVSSPMSPSSHFPLEKSESYKSIHSSTTVSMSGNSIQNLRDHIYASLLVIAKKYIENNKSNNENFNDHLSQYSDKNSTSKNEVELNINFNDFLHYLVSSEILKDLTETFRPRVLSLIAEKYAKPVRRASTQSFLMFNDDHATHNTETDHVHEVDLSVIYSDLYTYLIQQAHAVLSYLTESIRFDLKKDEVSRGNYSLTLLKNKDEDETNTNTKSKLLEDLNVLLSQSYDSLAELKFESSNNYHKERINILENKELRTNTELIISVYLEYGKFLLYWRKINIESSENNNNNNEILKNNEILEDARICFEYIYSLINLNNKDTKKKSNDIKKKDTVIIILYCNILMELGLFSHVELILLNLLISELNVKSNNYLLLNNLDEFLLWNDTKSQSKVSSLVYITLSVYFSLINKHLFSYKAICLSKQNLGGIYNLLYSLVNNATWCSSYGLFRCSESVFSLTSNTFQRSELENNFFERVEEIPITFLKKFKKLEIEILFISTNNYDSLLSKIDSLRFFDEKNTSDNNNSQTIINSSSNNILNDGDVSYYTLSKLLQVKLLRKVEQITGNSHYETIINNYILAFSNSPSQLSLHSYLNFLSLLASSPNSSSTSIQVASTAMKHFPKSSSLKLQLSLIYLTKSQFSTDENDDFVKYSFLVEENLRAANLLDPKNPEIWAGWTLYLLSQCINENALASDKQNDINSGINIVGSGKEILKQAEDSLFQCFRLGLSSIDILLKLAHSFMSVGMPSTSEYIINNCIKINTINNKNEPTSPSYSSYFYKLLGDSQLHQGNYPSAVENYQRYLYDENIVDNEKKISIALECISLLKLLGRDEEIVNVANILTYLNTSKLQQGVENEEYVDPSLFTASGNIDPAVLNAYGSDIEQEHV